MEQFANELAAKEQLMYWWGLGLVVFFVLVPYLTIRANKKERLHPREYPDPNLAQTPEPAPEEHNTGEESK
ncbi:MAG: hypothetical protein A2527_03700 [Candidatus Lambdaproteobacteria bacterium RIFOXYD2_FULL_50_16]|uniref:Uncharacterized protein n=1 Tax=Candidatus Lambdaproteobacteria bacterium RIFOXYD2_FULL_50_16 TaxID=1817772 RepID=A0A1F6GEY4_9PROT|nr:MAG: hypothetical protein A2527_03700 [Candidatus Lambdaproteobacteria bacterium RIFOXYD2_FULL_50_16]